MISFVLLFALAFAALPTEKEACFAVLNTIWDEAATPKCKCKTSFTEKTEGTTTTCACKDNELIINDACVTKTTCPGSDATKTLLNTEDNQCVASCTSEQVKIGNECQRKESCNGASNKPVYNAATNKCDACPPGTPIYHNDAKKCIVQTDCKTENAETLQDTSVPNLKMCGCVRSATYNNGKCNPECGDTCGKPNQKCQFKSDYSDTECVCGNGYQANTGADKATNPCVCPTATHEEKTVSNVKKCVAKAPTCDAAKHQKLNTAGNACECTDGYSTNTGAAAATTPCTCPTTNEVVKINDVDKCLAKCGENEQRNGEKCECKTGFEKKNNKCVKKENNGVNGLFVILAMALFFIF